MFLSSDDVKALTDRLLARSRADACAISVSGGEAQNLRFARGAATTNTAASDVRVRVSSHVGGRVGSVSTTSLDDAALSAALARSEEIARLLPVDPEYVAPLGPQNYSESRRYDPSIGELRLDALALKVEAVAKACAARGVNAFGCAASGRRFEAMATSNGLFAYDPRGEIELSVTARNKTDRWSGWAGVNRLAADALDATEVGRRAAEKAAREDEPVDLKPGDYPVVLEPAATAELASWLIHALDARAADEGRSFFSRPGRGARQGELLFDEKLTLRVDPGDGLAPSGALGYEGVPHRARDFIAKGAVESFYRSRAWAQKTDAEAVPHSASFHMGGGDASLEEMVRATKHGVLVTRLWYTNWLDPRELLLTGLTRDGNFLIENGRVTRPVRNMRFNESLAKLFRKIEALGPSERVWSAFHEGGACAAPPLLVERFSFASRSSGI
ncbi:MAG TPA: TldD/PmbA family protein [Methylocystis sp.]|nr:TldD/PmbA family protein [Methylocystis sp.]